MTETKGGSLPGRRQSAAFASDFDSPPLASLNNSTDTTSNTLEAGSSGAVSDASSTTQSSLRLILVQHCLCGDAPGCPPEGCEIETPVDTRVRRLWPRKVQRLRPLNAAVARMGA